MAVILSVWGGSAILFLILAWVLGKWVLPSKRWYGVLIDSRGRCSLTHFQLLAWTVAILSLIFGVFFGRLTHGAADPLDFKIPGQVLGLLGISVGSAATATAVKATKDVTAPQRIAASGVAASGVQDPPRLGQIFLLEEGQYADQAIDIGKYQNFIFTIVLVIAYGVLSVHVIVKQGGSISALPSFSGTFLILVGISQAGYVANKLPNQAGTPTGLTVKNRGAPDSQIVPRNPRARRRRDEIAGRALKISQGPDAGDAAANWLRAEQEIDSRGGG